MAKALIGLGSNLGDGRRNLLAAWRMLGDTTGISLGRLSHPYRSKPLGFASPNWFTNAVGFVDTELTPGALLARLLAVEKSLGRDRGLGMDRTVDLDLLDYDGQLLNAAELTLPHPGMAQRPFVLAPLVELAPEWQHPVRKESAAQMLARLHDPDQVATPLAWPEGELLP
jgi:2-amino-4-hydroxy-6-hydroxymethyldihydropteridine diphosphokinase